MAYVAPPTRTTGTIITASIWNQDVVSNASAIYGGAMGITSQAALDFIYAASASHLARLAKGTALQFPRINAAADGWEFASPATPPKIILTTNFETAGRFNGLNLKAGSGNPQLSYYGLYLITGATNASYAGVSWVISNNGNDRNFLGSPEFAAYVSYVSMVSAGEFWVGLGNLTMAGAGFTWTDDHAGFKVVYSAGAMRLYATQANGTTETASAELATVTSGGYDFFLRVNGTTSIDYYWRVSGGAWSSATNLTTNMPRSTIGYIVATAGLGNKNTTSNNDAAMGGMMFSR